MTVAEIMTSLGVQIIIVNDVTMECLTPPSLNSMSIHHFTNINCKQLLITSLEQPVITWRQYQILLKSVQLLEIFYKYRRSDKDYLIGSQ